jgi:hypothetical protein
LSSQVIPYVVLLDVVAMTSIRARLVYSLMTSNYEIYQALGEPGILTNSYGFTFALWKRIREAPDRELYSKYAALIKFLAAAALVQLPLLGIWMASFSSR